MPGNYTDYDPAQPLSQKQAAALSEVKKIIEARMTYNKNLLEFMLKKENEGSANTLIKTLLPATNTHSLLSLKKNFIRCIANDFKFYGRYIQHIETCKTMTAFDDLYFQIFMASESQKYNETEVEKREEALLKYDNMSSVKSKKLLEESQASKKERDISELKYYQEICSMLEKHISLRSREFKRHHEFICRLSPENVSSVGIGWETALEEESYSSIKLLNRQLKSANILNKPTSIDTAFAKINEMHIAIKTNKLEPDKQQLPPHPLDSFDSFNAYRFVRHFFDLYMNFLYTGNKLLYPEKKPKPPKKIRTTTATTSSSVDLNVKTTTEPSIDSVVEQKECAAALTELALPVAAPITQPTELHAKVSQCVLTFPMPMQEQKNDTPMLLIELSEIHPALQFIAGLHPAESATLLSWTQKAPHMQVEINELKRTIKNLNGKIDMSSGGSHHRIIFKNSFAFVDAFEQESTTSTGNAAKGTLVKQHGKGKSSRFLPSYAIKTFMQTLQKMGVTETILRIYTSAHRSCATFKNPQDKMALLTNAQDALVKDQSKMLLLLGIYKSKKNQKGDCSVLRKLHLTHSGGKGATQKLIETVFYFLGLKKPK